MPNSEVHSTRCFFALRLSLGGGGKCGDQRAKEGDNELESPKRGRDKTKRSRPRRLSFSPKRQAAGKRDDRQVKQNGLRKARQRQGEERRMLDSKN